MNYFPSFYSASSSFTKIEVLKNVSINSLNFFLQETECTQEVRPKPQTFDQLLTF